jgi:hypothetical protein
MPSPALTAWSTSSAAALSQLEAAHRAVGGTRAGRRTNTLQLNYAYVLLLCAHFQAYCRGLHSDAAQLLVDAIDPGIAVVLHAGQGDGCDYRISATNSSGTAGATRCRPTIRGSSLRSRRGSRLPGLVRRSRSTAS